MDLTETFERLFTGKHFTSDAEFERACEDFRKETGVRFARRHVLSRQEPLPNLPDLLLKQGQFTCSVSYCNAFFAVGSKKCGVYVTRFNMHHIHGPMPEEEYNVVCDLTSVFRQYFPVDHYSTFEEFHNLLIAFQSHTGSSYVKRHTVRWPADAIDKQHLVYARAHFECVRYGWSESNATSRPVNSKRIGCKAYVVIQTYKGYVQIFHLNMQHNHEITSDVMTGNSRSSRRPQTPQICAPSNNVYAYTHAVEGVPQPTECIPQTILQPVKIRRIQAVSETVKLENYMLNKMQQSKMAVLDAQLQSLRNMAFAEFGIIGENGEYDETAIEMCEELQQLENSWRQALVDSEEQREAAPILVEFASASAAAEEREDLKVDAQTV
ncbi:unnamed protein product [Hymenolepis diminuta]|uniref:FAR1 domain-containing protein n=2 Tax=Hymenolepis diminuta TaxID=6216 RepID=A0A0R3SVQ7_HYMDI|nr:unnamed protein product [Hymenolepis diminuta]